MAMESKVYLLSNFCARSRNHFQISNQLSFSSSNSSPNLWQCKDLPLLARRIDTKIRAERVTRSRPQEDPENWQKMDREEYRAVEDPIILDAFDSNAENIRRRSSKRMTYSRPEMGDESSPSTRQRSNRYEDSRWDMERNGSYKNSEWDYESEPPTAEAQSPKARQWWFTDDGEDSYELDEDDEDERDWLSWLNLDVRDAFTLLRWGLPAAFLLCSAVLPVMVGNPLLLLFGFTILPTAVKYLSPRVKDFLRSVANPFDSSSSATSNLRSERPSTYSPRSRNTTNYSDFASPSQPISRTSDSVVPRQKAPLQTSSLGGWDDLVEDRSRIQALTRRPVKRRGKSGKLVKREQPLVIRILLAFFPFLRGWAGLF